MTDIINEQVHPEVSGNPIYIDNGTKTPVIDDIADRFYGNGNYSGNPNGTDTDGDGISDSWVVVLPVIECQNPGDQCAGHDAQEIKGFVCFDMHEVEVTPDKIIKGDFICPTDPRCNQNGFRPGGGLAGGISASFPVLVR